METKEKEVVYVPAYCSVCGKQIAKIAVAPKWKDYTFVLTFDHKCEVKNEQQD